MSTNVPPNARRGHLPPVPGHTLPGRPAISAEQLIAEVAVLRKQMDARVAAERTTQQHLAEVRERQSLTIRHGIELIGLDQRVTRATEYALGGLLIGALALFVAVALTFGWL